MSPLLAHSGHLVAPRMSAFGGKADILRHRNVRWVPLLVDDMVGGCRHQGQLVVATLRRKPSQGIYRPEES